MAICAAIGAAASGQVQSAQAVTSHPAALLAKAAKATITVSYTASQTVTVSEGRSTRVEKLSIAHLSPDRTKWTYLSGNSVDRIVVDAAGSRWQYVPRTNQLIFSSAVVPQQEMWAERDLGRVLANYVVAQTGAEVVAGRKTAIVSVTPKRGHYGPTKRMWVDVASGLILRSERVTADKRIRVLMDIQSLKIVRSIPLSRFSPPSRVRKQTVMFEDSASLPLSVLSRQWKHAVLVPKTPPSGYTLESARIINRGNSSYIHLRYFDGLISLSLFEEPSKVADTHRNGARMDMVHGSSVDWTSNAPFKLMSWRERGVKLTLVGDMSRECLLGVANSVRLFGK